jgi:hypothetical protein
MGDKEAKGVIVLLPAKNRKSRSEGSVVEYNTDKNSLGEFTLHLQKRSFVMRADNTDAAQNWGRAIDLWTNYRVGLLQS